MLNAAPAARRLPVRVRTLTIVAIVSILAPMIFVAERDRASASAPRSARSDARPLNAPPEPFKLHSEPGASGLFESLAGVFASESTSATGERTTTSAAAESRSERPAVTDQIEGETQNPLPTGGVNVALASNGGTASTSSTYNGNYPAAGAIDGDRKGLNWGSGGGWNDSTGGSYPDWLQIDFAGTKTIDEIDVFTVQDNYGSPSEPTLTDTFTSYGITDFDVQYWNGSSWATVTGGSITSNNHIWTKVAFSQITTSKIRVVVNNSLATYSRIIEVEAWSVGQSPTPSPTPTPGPRVNYALASNGGSGTASSEYHSGHSPAGTIDGDRKGLNWGSGGGWNDATASTYPDWLQVDFSGTKTIDEIDVFTVQDSYWAPTEPTLTDTFSQYGITDFDVQYWNGSAWTTVTGGSVTGNNKIWRQFAFTPVATTKIRVTVNNSLVTYSRITELEAWGSSGGPSTSASDLGKARLSPRNATGGTDLYSQNFSWSAGLVNLPGRSGMDLQMGLSYNSLVWTKAGTEVIFDADYSNVAPGFRFGFPEIEPVYYDTDKSKNVYLMVMPSGARVEFRETGTAGTFVTADSSYAQLKITGSGGVGDLTPTVTDMSGTQYTYDWKTDAFKCTQIKDRNGNYLTINYNTAGDLETVTDTLGRVVTVNYDSYPSPTTITQTWKDTNGSGSNVTHTYAAFAYTTKTISTDFDGLTVSGPANSTGIRVLDSVTYADGSSTKFHHNGYAQVWKIESIGADSASHVLNRVRTNLETPAADQTDVPRFTQVWNYVENFNAGAETTATMTRSTGQSYTSAGGGSATATKIEVAMTGHPHNTVSKTWYHESGWKEGLPIGTEDWADGTSGSERKRWTWTDYTQDDTGVAYTTNPRVVESKVGDGTNTKRTTIAYHLEPSTTVAVFGLPSEVKVYDADQTTVLKQSNTEYELGSNYTSRRIIGLPSEVEVQGLNQLTSSMELVSRVTYAYDQGDFSDSGLQQTISPVQHDSTNYGASFSYRGNMTGTTRWDVTQPTNGAAAITASLKFNTAGSVVANTTPWDGTNTRTVRIGYADVWNDNPSPNRSTYAYPTVMTDPAGSTLGATGHSSTVKYRYDTGANVEADSPAPAGQMYGKKSKRIFDSIGRLDRNSVSWNPTGTGWQEQSYVRYEYPANGVQSKTFAPIVDQDNDGNIAEDEVYSESLTDGAGRVRMSRTEHPGSTGGWASTFVEYDILGRVKRQSVPTETNSSYTPAGDDAAGAVWTHLKYDWMGRTVRKINTDGVDQTALNDSDVLISYEGCGCAGGLVTTVEGELVPRTDTSGNARRKQKSYADIFGRTFKSETYEWDGTTVYSAAVQTFDGADRPVRTRQYAGSVSSTTYQDTTATFDGHGRLHQSHRPEQRDNSNNLTYTTYAYNPDQSVHVKMDARGATSTFTYDARGLVTNVANEWTPPPTPERRNFALPANGATASASSTFYSGQYPIASAFNGNRAGNGWGSGTGGWQDNTINSHPDWLQVDLDGEKVIDEIDVFTIQDNTSAPSEPTETMTFSQHGIVNFEIQYWDGSSWQTVPGGNVTGNNKVWRKFTFSPVTTDKVRVSVTWSKNATYRYSRIAELEVWGPDDTAPSVNSNVSFTYDDLGNRLSMTDGQGGTAYSYDPLSRLKDETRNFNDTLANAPLPNNSFKLEYTYGLSGNLKSITDPFGDQIQYSSDKAGRLSAVTGTSYANVTEYAEGAQYTAWGGLKDLQYGNNVQSATTFNNRLLPGTHDLTGPGSTQIMDKSYQYYNDGRLKFVDDEMNGIFDRLNIYDHAGRIKEGKSGAEASGGSVATQDMNTQLPYRQSYGFNAFGDMTQRNNLHWGVENWQGRSNNLSYTYQNGRVAGWHYDADGRTLMSYESDQTYYSDYDARGLLVRHNTTFSVWNTFDQNIVNRYYNGDGREVKRQRTIFAEDVNMTQPPYGAWTVEVPTYYIRSSVLGGETLTEINGTGRKIKTNVIAAGATIATQSEYAYNNTTNEAVAFHHNDASGMSHCSTTATGAALYGDGQFDGAPAETDPMGGNMGTGTPYIETQLLPPPEEPNADWGFIPLESDAPMYVNGQRVTCELDGMAIGCAQAQRALESGSAIPSAIAHLQTQNGFRVTSYGSGLYTYSYTNSGSNSAPPPQGGDPNITYGTHNQTVTGMFTINWMNLTWGSPRPFTESEKKILKDNFKTVVDSGCEQFFNNLLNKANEMAVERGEKSRTWSKDLHGMFATVASQGSFSYGDTILKYYGQDGSTTKGSFQGKDAGIEFALYYMEKVVPGLYGPTPKKIEDQKNHQLAVSMALTAVHEIAHLSGFSDNELALAAAELLKDGERFKSQDISLVSKSKGETIRASSYWTNRLGEQCDATGKRRSLSSVRPMR